MPEEAVEEAPLSPHEGFVVHELEMKAFMRYLHKTSPPVTFPGKFTAITGPTGAGKTTILDAITFALYKRSTRTDIQGIKISEICGNGGYARLAFSQGGSTYTVKRGFSSTGSPYLELERDGKPIRGTIPELETTIQDIIGLDYDGFRNSTFVRQEEMKQLGADRPSERLEVFQKLFRLETFERAAEVAKGRLDVAKGEMHVAEGELLILREQLSQVEGLQEELKDWEGRVERFGRSLKGVEDSLSTKQEELTQLEKGHETYIRERARFEGLQRSVGDLEGRLREKREALAKSSELKSSTEGLAREVERLEGLEEESRGLMDRQQRKTLLRKEIDSVERRRRDAEASYRSIVSDLERKVGEEERRLANLSTDMGAEEAFEVLRQEGTLEERVARIDKEIEWLAERRELVESLKREQEESRQSLAEVKGKTQGINRETFLVSEIGERVAAIRRELEERHSEWESKEGEFRKEYRELELKTETAAFGAEERRRLSTLREALENLGEKRKLLQQAREELQRLVDLEELIEEMESQREEESLKLQKLSSSISQAEGDEEAYQTVRVEVESLRDKRDEAARVLYEAKANLKAAQDRLRDVRKLESKSRDVESRLGELRAAAEVHTILREGVFHKKGVVMYAINRLLPELEIETSKNLNDLTNGRLKRVKLETHEEARGYGIRILVEGVDGEWHDVGIFSGGERTQINAALRFAIAKELASMPQVGRTYGRMKTLFIDEGDLGSLDTESSRELFVSKLFKMGDSFEKVILITHLTEVAEKFPGRVRVAMTPHGESTIEVVA